MNDRRDTPRVMDPIEHGIRTVRIRPGHVATLIDVSAAGALLETSHRLLPGTFVELNMETDSHRIRVRGRVVRCTVAYLRAAAVFYRGGIAFDSRLPLFVRESGYPIPAADQSDAHAGRAHATRTVV